MFSEIRLSLKTKNNFYKILFYDDDVKVFLT